MAFFTMAMPWNEGEQRMHEILQVPERDNPTASTLTPQASFLLQRAPLLAIGTLDSENRPWTTLTGGQAGFSETLGGAIIGTRTIVDGINDPVVQALVGGATKGEMVQGNQKMVSGLTIDLMTRKRVKIFGRVLAACLDEVKVDYEGDTSKLAKAPERQDQLQLVTKIEQSLGNCPKYLNQYEIRPALVTSKLISKSSSLTTEAKDLISKADMFFLSSSTTSDMDTNHRGGPPGFVRIVSSTEIVYPEYSGNRLYQTLGNLQMNPKVGITFPDYETGDVVYATGTAEILVLDAAAKLLPGSNLAVKIKVDEVRFVESGLPFRGTRKTPSPYNPLVRTLASEGNIKASYTAERKTATLVEKTIITPTIARFKFSVPEGISYKPGQWVALDFSQEMNEGYSHMRDEDPTSLNDDFVRTFTISSSPSSSSASKPEQVFEITIRKVGSVTNFLFKQNDRAGFSIPVLGVGGDFHIHPDEPGTPSRDRPNFVAAGVGITPLLGQIPLLRTCGSEQGMRLDLRVDWTMRAADIDLAIDTLKRYPVLASYSTSLYITGDTTPEAVQRKITELREMKTMAYERRMTKNDIAPLRGDGSGWWYVCAAKPFRKIVLEWLGNYKEVFFEDFDY
jgi:predicted pyridoxine 5'-phosphate oxidase superfamily flavin-nucleotide-binding protein